ncbi:hypothetical protein QBC34DRAFT_411528 [Podospora aff. communis PSN243]|uniref:F-box domain-containing protein n=1 Tax=Podospora aff. communis PSN243 TaxID=3040156 RepID=A0AAV9GGY2_9PEZI|nr:hypothetical protein QBC34DRAFT_411528 [Podospora aff. communis PSN243]
MGGQPQQQAQLSSDAFHVDGSQPTCVSFHIGSYNGHPHSSPAMAPHLATERWLSIARFLSPPTILSSLHAKMADSSSQREPFADYPSPFEAAQARRNLCALCLVCRNLRGVAQRVLYEEVSLGLGQMPLDSQKPGRLPSLVATLVARPDLAALVKRAFINPDVVDSESPEDILKLACDVCRALGIACPMRRMRFGSESLPYVDTVIPLSLERAHVVPLVLSLMPNLEHIIYHPLPGAWPYWMPYAKACRFPRLKTFEVVDGDSAGRWDAEAFPGIDGLAETLTVPAFRWLDAFNTNAVKRAFPRVVNLRIAELDPPLSDDDHNRWSTMTSALEKFRGLQEFHCDVACRRHPELVTLLRALECGSGGTLRHLTLTISFHMWERKNTGVLSAGLWRFSNLETLVFKDMGRMRYVSVPDYVGSPTHFVRAASLPLSLQRFSMGFHGVR